MSGDTDPVKSRAKEAVGMVAGNKDVGSEDKADRQAGDGTQTIEHAKRNIEMFVDRADGTGEHTMKKIRSAGP